MTKPHSLRDLFKSAATAAVLAAPLALTPALMAQDPAPAADSAVAAAPAVSGLTVGPVTFGAPWMLLGLGTLPLLWLLMRSIPPKPQIERFPAMRILFNLKSEKQEPASMPLWQRTLRIAAAGAVITGLAQPELNPLQPLKGEGPVIAVVDNGWASAPHWEARTTALTNLIDRAAHENRQVILLPTAPPADGGPIRVTGPVDAAKARDMLKELTPHPWPVDREAALKALEAAGAASDAHIVWLSDGNNAPGSAELAAFLSRSGSTLTLEDTPGQESRLLLPPEMQGDSMTVTVRRPKAGGMQDVALIATDEQGRPVGQTHAQFGASDTEAKATFNLPQDARNAVTRIAISGENSAGASILLDERWRRRPVGLVRPDSTETSQPLLDEGNYVERALSPYVDLRQGSVDEIFKRPPAVLILTDSAPVDARGREKIAAWIKEGGTLLRFAGEHMTEAPELDDLLPVRLRPGSRTLGESALTNETVGKIAPFDEKSPFYGIKAPENVGIEQEVMAQPEFDLEQRTWARLQDGTPLVTAKQLGKGQIVLVHTTANTSWSNLALSGAFVEMMRAVVSHSQSASNAEAGGKTALPPLKIMDARGELTSPSGDVKPLSPDAALKGIVTPQSPPGLYGDESARHAHNLAGAVPELVALPDLPGMTHDTYAHVKNQSDLSGPLLAAAFALIMADIVILMAQQKTLPWMGNKHSNGLPPGTAPQMR